VRRSSGSCESPWDSFELRCFVDVGTLSRGQRKNSMYIKEDGSFLDIEPSCQRDEYERAASHSSSPKNLCRGICLEGEAVSVQTNCQVEHRVSPAEEVHSGEPRAASYRSDPSIRNSEKNTW
jgi:hypothetical protein